jgi:AbrB family looped-hinge helix DNA binding protein
MVILCGMTHRVGPKGQVVLPKLVRDRLGIRPGDEVVVEAAGDEAHIRRVERGADLRGLLRDGASTQDVEAEHLQEIERDEVRARGTRD